MPTHPLASRTVFLTTLAMLAFAANSILCRRALADGSIDPSSFTAIRVASGAVSLWAILTVTGRIGVIAGSWSGALALFAYAIAFAFAYISLSAGTGALILFGAVQATMITIGMVRGERLTATQLLGLAVALAGLAALLAPGATAPAPVGAILMMIAGMAWGVYSILGRGAADPLAETAGNFMRAMPMAAVALVLMLASSQPLSVSTFGVINAILSGAVASGIGYAIWYAALPGLTPVQGASVQLSVPVITAIAGTLALGEAISLRLALCSIAVLGGIAIVITNRRRPR